MQAIWPRLAQDYARGALEWTDRHPGLGCWIGAIGSMLAIFAAWYLARREYFRTRRREAAQKRGEIDLIGRLISDFERLLQHYVDAALSKRTDASNSYAQHSHVPEWHSMVDLADLPVLRWPSLQAYAEFKQYWYRCVRILETAKMQPVDQETLSARLIEHDKALPRLRNALQMARRSA